MPTYSGSCHCGRVTFEVDATPTALSECNCSLCRAKGALYLKIVEIEAVRILSGEDDTTIYQFGTRTAKHYFCRRCGVHVFHRPRIAPERWSVNARALRDFDTPALPHTHFDGENWEASAAAEGWKPA